MLLLFCSSVFAKEKQAHITGDTYLGSAGSKIILALNKVICTLNTTGDESSKNLSIDFTCGDIQQSIWHTGSSGFEIDQPRFELLWAGDIDGDGLFDLKVETSPKYSCMQQTIYLSSLASEDLLVGIAEQSLLQCY